MAGEAAALLSFFLFGHFVTAITHYFCIYHSKVQMQPPNYTIRAILFEYPHAQKTTQNFDTALILYRFYITQESYTIILGW